MVYLIIPILVDLWDVMYYINIYVYMCVLYIICMLYSCYKQMLQYVCVWYSVMCIKLVWFCLFASQQ